MIRHALAESWPYLALIGLGVAAVGLFGRDPEADEYTIDDYRQPESSSEDGGVPTVPRPSRPVTVAGNQVFAETAAAMGVWPVDAGAVVAVVADQYGRSPADRAARFLREIAADARPAVVSPASDRDYTGAFPVVRAA